MTTQTWPAWRTSIPGRRIAAQRLIADTLEQLSTVELIVTLDRSHGYRFGLACGCPRNHFATLSAPARWPRLESGEGARGWLAHWTGQIGYTAMEVATQRLMLVPDAPTRRYIPCELVTKANLDDFAQRHAAANLDVRPAVVPATA